MLPWDLAKSGQRPRKRARRRLSSDSDEPADPPDHEVITAPQDAASSKARAKTRPRSDRRRRCKLSTSQTKAGGEPTPPSVTDVDAENAPDNLPPSAVSPKVEGAPVAASFPSGEHRQGGDVVGKDPTPPRDSEVKAEEGTSLGAPQPKGIFALSQGFYILRKGLTKTRWQVIANQLKSRGGRVFERWSDHTPNPVGVIVTVLPTWESVAAGLQLPQFTRPDDHPALNGIRFVTPEWVTRAILNGALPSSGIDEAFSVGRLQQRPRSEALDTRTCPDEGSGAGLQCGAESQATIQGSNPNLIDLTFAASSDSEPELPVVAPHPPKSQGHAEFAGDEESQVQDEEHRVQELVKLLENGNVRGKLPSSHWQCMTPSSLKAANHNEHITSVLEVLQQRQTLQNDSVAPFRALQYRKAIQALKKFPERVHSADQLRRAGFRGAGEKIMAKIDQICRTGTCDAVEKGKPAWEETVKLFTQVHGVGPTVAREWYHRGYRTIDDLRHDRLHLLNDAQRVGTKYLRDFLQRIPRQEVYELFKQVEDVAVELYPGIECYCMGSYRRGKETCGDIDLILTHPQPPTSGAPPLSVIVAQLTGMGFLIDDLHHGPFHVKYMGVCRLPTPGSLARRIDILWVPYDEKGASMIYFTGNDIFNRSLRLLASKKGMSLSQHGLFADVLRVRREKLTQGDKIAGGDEREIFQILGAPYLPPHERNP